MEPHIHITRTEEALASSQVLVTPSSRPSSPRLAPPPFPSSLPMYPPPPTVMPPLPPLPPLPPTSYPTGLPPQPPLGSHDNLPPPFAYKPDFEHRHDPEPLPTMPSATVIVVESPPQPKLGCCAACCLACFVGWCASCFLILCCPCICCCPSCLPFDQQQLEQRRNR